MSRYQHDVHAGNFADVHKHLVLWQVLDSLRGRDKPFVAIDLHAGAGGYSLSSARARQTDEAASGIGRLWSCAGSLPPIVEDYLSALRDLQPNPPHLAEYFGSPLLIQARLRERDQLIACEQNPETQARLKGRLTEDARCHVHRRDAREAATALFPPEPRRGLVLLDPPYERKMEYREVVAMVQSIRQRLEYRNDPHLVPRRRRASGSRDARTAARRAGRSLVNQRTAYRPGPGTPSRAGGLGDAGVAAAVAIGDPPSGDVIAGLAAARPRGRGGLYQAGALENGAGDPTLRRVETILGKSRP